MLSRLSKFLVLATIVIVASAHVTVQPREVTSKKYSTFLVSCPTEKPVATVKLRLEFPEGLRVSRIRAKQGWISEVDRDTTKAIRSVTWSGGKIGPDEYDEFAFSARITSEPALLAIKAYQTYENGEVVEWTNMSADPKAQHPAPKISVVAEPSRFASSMQGNWLGGAALALGLVTLTMAMRNGRNGTGADA